MDFLKYMFLLGSIGTPPPPPIQISAVEGLINVKIYTDIKKTYKKNITAKKCHKKSFI